MDASIARRLDLPRCRDNHLKKKSSEGVCYHACCTVVQQYRPDTPTLLLNRGGLRELDLREAPI